MVSSRCLLASLEDGLSTRFLALSLVLGVGWEGPAALPATLSCNYQQQAVTLRPNAQDMVMDS